MRVNDSRVSRDGGRRDATRRYFETNGHSIQLAVAASNELNIKWKLAKFPLNKTL